MDCGLFMGYLLTDWNPSPKDPVGSYVARWILRSSGGIWTSMFSSVALFLLLPFDNHRKAFISVYPIGMDARCLKPQDCPLVLALVNRVWTIYEIEQLNTVLFASIRKKAELHKEKLLLVPRNFSHLFSGSLKPLWKDLSLCGLCFKL